MERWREKLHEVIFEADTPAGRAFDVGLLIAILLSILVVMLDSVPSIRAEHGQALMAAEWFFTILFTIEYVLRILSVKRPLGYILSFWGIVDLLAILPTYLTLVDRGTHYGVVVRSLRLLRVFRILKMARVVQDANALWRAVKTSRNKIAVFLMVVISVVAILGSAMYVVEASENGFTSIPESMYWAVVTMTTVGYGDIAPKTVIGKLIASVVMILGYSLIVVPTGIITAEAVRQKPVTTQACPSCSKEGHDVDARHCKYCGSHL